jgi:uncharacterized protein (DUF433 family)
MTLESYFQVLAPDDIRIKGTRVGIETVLYEYIHRGQSAEQIAERFDTLTLEQVYATILYYLHNRETISAYLADWLEYGERVRAVQAQDPTFQRLHERVQQMRVARGGEVTVGAAAR